MSSVTPTRRPNPPRQRPVEAVPCNSEYFRAVPVVEAEPTEVVQLLQGGELNAGLIYDSADDPAFTGPELVIDVLLEEQYQVLVASHSPFAARAEIDMADLADADWICSRDPNETSDRVLRRACHRVGIEPRVLMRTDDLSMIHGLVAEGLGCTLTTPAALDTRFAVQADNVCGQ